MIIPARGGSKGLPGKNTRPLAGKPLLAWSVEAGLGARGVDKVFVSTDSAEIAAAARAAGAEVIDRPAELAGDTASSESALLHALDVIEAAHGPLETVVFGQCTAPLMTSADIDGVLDAMSREDADTGFAAVPFHRFVWRADEAQGWNGVNHDSSVRLRRQDREPEYLEAGSVYAMKADGFRRRQHRFFGRIALHPIDPERDVEIDSLNDFQLAEALLHARPKASKALPAPLQALVFDFDGVFTDNGVILDSEGNEHIRCDRGDGMGISLLRARGLPMMVLSTEENPILRFRCEKLRLPYRHGLSDKRAALEEWAQREGFDLAKLAYMGNDINDLGCFAAVGFTICPADGHLSARQAADWVTLAPGGAGAVREAADFILGHLSEAERLK